MILYLFNTLCLFLRYASLIKDGSEYFILLIISDGVISDMAQTKESIVNVCSKKISATELLHPIREPSVILISLHNFVCKLDVQ